MASNPQANEGQPKSKAKTKEELEAEQQAAPWGLYHLVPAGETTWHAYAQHVIGLAHAQGLMLKARPEAVHPIRTEDYPLPAPRPKNSRLSPEKFERTFGSTLPPWQISLPPVIASPAGARQSMLQRLSCRK